MEKELVGILIMMLMLSATFSVVGEVERKTINAGTGVTYAKNSLTGLNCFFIDISQLDTVNYGLSIYNGRYELHAQEFIPRISHLAKIELKLFRFNATDPFPLNLSIRAELDEEDIAVSSTMGKTGWVAFYFDNVTLTPYKNYFMVLEALEGDSSHMYCWEFYQGAVDKYPNGQAWDNGANGKWTVTYTTGFDGKYFDFCFRTYGWDNPPEQVTITGPGTGDANIEYQYTFSATDSDSGYITKYEIDWGDGLKDVITGAFIPGDAVTKNHTWLAEGTYNITARAYDARQSGDWGTLTVTMPFSYNKPLPHILDWLFQRFPNAFPILKHLLEY